MILLIDNYDSFVFNLARYLERLGQETHVVRNDAIDVAEVRSLAPSAIVLSPGPCTPNEAGCSLDIVRKLWREFPMLGVCLGHQTIGAAFGATIVRAPEPMHGRTSVVTHDDSVLYESVPTHFEVCRYHSLVVDESSLARQLTITCRTGDRLVMGLQHVAAPVFGVQFHPEAILTEYGFQLLSNFLNIAQQSPLSLPDHSTERLPCPSPQPALPTAPVTF